MPLYVIATPIGVDTDISKRAVETLTSCTVVIGEDHKNTSKFLKFSGVPQKEIYILNEHSKPADLPELCELARTQNVALISDCGTPGFCDPGADLVHLCRQKNVRVQSIPGPSSLMAFLSVCGKRLDRFYFRGFLPAENSQRRKELESMKDLKTPTIVLDTPYRLKKLLQDIDSILPKAKLILGVELSTLNEEILEGSAASLLGSLKQDKAEFVLLIY